MKHTIALLLLLSVLCAAFTGCSSDGGDKLRFKEATGGYALYRYKGSSKKTEFTVPNEYDGLPVVEILDFALANAEYLTSISIGKNVRIIGEWSFTNSLKLTEIKVSADNTAFADLDGVLYNKELTELVAYPNGKTPLIYDSADKVIGGAEIILPKSVKKIRNNAFYTCGNLYKIVFNDSLQEIGNKAFIKCENLQSFTFPGTLQTIGVDAFSYCDSLTSLTIPPSVVSIGDYAFFSLSSVLSEIVIERANSEGMTLGKNWVPNQKDSVEKKVAVRFSPPGGSK